MVKESGRVADLSAQLPKKAFSAVSPRKGKEVKEQKEKVRSIEEILSNKPKGLSKPQENLFRALKKGFRIEGVSGINSNIILKAESGEKTLVENAVFRALRKRLNITDSEIAQFYLNPDTIAINI